MMARDDAKGRTIWDPRRSNKLCKGCIYLVVEGVSDEVVHRGATRSPPLQAVMLPPRC